MDWAKPKTRDDDERAAGDRNNTLSCSCLVSLLSKTAGDSLFWTDNSLVLSAAPSGPEGGLRGHDPVQNEYEADFWAANGSTSGQTGCLRACRGSFRPPGSGHRAAPPVQNDGWQNLFWTRVTDSTIRSHSCCTVQAPGVRPFSKLVSTARSYWRSWNTSQFALGLGPIVRWKEPVFRAVITASFTPGECRRPLFRRQWIRVRARSRSDRSRLMQSAACNRGSAR